MAQWRQFERFNQDNEHRVWDGDSYLNQCSTNRERLTAIWYCSNR